MSDSESTFDSHLVVLREKQPHPPYKARDEIFSSEQEALYESFRDFDHMRRRATTVSDVPICNQVAGLANMSSIELKNLSGPRINNLDNSSGSDEEAHISRSD